MLGRKFALLISRKVEPLARLETLGVYVRQLESEVDEGERKIGALDRLTALKELIIIGDLSPRLKKVIFPYLKRFKIQFKKAV